MKTSIPLVVAGLIAVGACADRDEAAAPPAEEPWACPAPYVECDGNPSTLCETRLDTDPANCGSCHNACHPPGPHRVATCVAGACSGACEDGFVDCDHDEANGCEEPGTSCGTRAIVPSVAAAMGLGVDDTFVYYGTKGTPPDYLDGKLFKVPKNGGVPITLATGLNRPLNLALDATNVYWTNGGHGDINDGSVQFVAKTGGTPKTIAGPMVRPGNPIVVGDMLYWTVREQPLGRIVAARKDGTDVSPTDIVKGIANATDLQRAGDTLVWASSGLLADGADALVERAGLDGSGRVTLNGGLASPSYQLGIDPLAVFVGSMADGSVRRIPFDLGAVTTLAMSVGQPQEIIADGATIYMTTGTTGRVLAIPARGGTPVVIADAETFTSYLAMDADSLYWTDGFLSGEGAIRKAKKPGR